MEYYRGIIPGTLTNATLAAVGLNAGVFQFDVRRQPGRFDLTQSFQTSTNLQSWVPAAGVLTNSVAPELDGTETLHLQLPIPPGPENFYLRLVIGQN
jgi:hypothetical protein